MNAIKKQQRRDTLRKQIRASRRSLSPTHLNRAATNLKPKAHNALMKLNAQNPLKRVAGYLAFQGEIDVSPVMDGLRALGIHTYVPMLNGETLQFARWSENTPFTENRFGIVEPNVPKNEWIDGDTLDAILVPLVAFDKNGNRMGMGGGFYDKTFACRRTAQPPPWLIGVAHSQQLVDDVFEDWWDVKLDQIISV